MVKLFEIYQDDEKFVHLRKTRLLSREAVTISDTGCAASFVIDKLCVKKLATEHLYTLCLSASAELIAVIQISSGGVQYACVPLDKIFQSALLTNTTELIIVHNHPSGRCVPSQDDLRITNKLVKAGELIGVQIIDHIIVGEHSFYSIIKKIGGNL